MTIEQERLISIIEFAQQSARLASKPAATISQHNSFSLFEEKAQGRPALHFNQTEEDTEREIWLVIERLHETTPPSCQNELLKPWLEISQGPETVPTLKASALDTKVREAEKLAGKAVNPPQSPITASHSSVMFSDYPRGAEVRAAFQVYLDSMWKPWAEEEKQRRETIRLYAKLFTLRQQLEGGLIETPTEFVWGVGVGIWNRDGTAVQYPVLTQSVEIFLNPLTAAIEIAPRDVDARLETDWYASVDNPGLAGLEKQSKEFFAKCTTTFSPFDRGTFEPLLRAAVTHLDPNGKYWPDRTWAGDRSLPTADNNLVTVHVPYRGEGSVAPGRRDATGWLRRWQDTAVPR
jgi:hypothetical protein